MASSPIFENSKRCGLWIDYERIKELNAEADRWLKGHKFFERNDSLEALASSTSVTPEEHRQILGAGKRRPISIRIPEKDLAEIQKIAKKNGRKYQQLIVQAVGLYIDNYYRLHKMKKF